MEQRLRDSDLLSDGGVVVVARELPLSVEVVMTDVVGACDQRSGVAQLCRVLGQSCRCHLAGLRGRSNGE